MLISTIIATVARPTLERAVRSALDQDLGGRRHEVIVVNDSGAPLAAADWRSDGRVTVVDSRRVDRCFARNTGAVVSRGRYLHFLDDDDYLLPGALAALLDAAREAEFVWTYGGVQRIDDDGRPTSLSRPADCGNLFLEFVAGEAMPLGAGLIDAGAFLRAGGFDPAFVVSQDRELACRLAWAGEFGRTDAVVVAIRVGPAGATTTRWDRADELGRMVREKSLDLPGAAARLIDSARGEPARRGRIARVYLASMALNARRGRVDRALGRVPSLVRCVGLHPFSPSFWQGIRRRAGEADGASEQGPPDGARARVDRA
jgi:GT2 family glycosyltransferase